MFTERKKLRFKLRHAAFSLVELLVVVTIIVVLLAMLAPAMNRAVYEARLAECAVRQKTAAAGVITYTFDHKRYYPPHLVDKYDRQSAETPTAPLVYLAPMTLADTTDIQAGFDIRPPLEGYVLINKMLQDPLAPQPVELEHSPPDAVMEASYVLFWGWQYNQPSPIGRGQGMFRMGDGFTFTNPATMRTSRYKVLVGDMDLFYPGSAQSGHADRGAGLLYPLVGEGVPAFGVFWWLSRWATTSRTRGLLDDNFAFDDGSVRRIKDVPDWNQPVDKTPELDRIAVQYDARRYGGDGGSDILNIPRQ